LIQYVPLYSIKSSIPRAKHRIVFLFPDIKFTLIFRKTLVAIRLSYLQLLNSKLAQRILQDLTDELRTGYILL
jgi:hypothetical protein